MASKAKANRKVTRGSTNVFADLGYPDAEERQTKLRLAHAINTTIGEKRAWRNHRPRAGSASRNPKSPRSRPISSTDFRSSG